MTIEETKKQQEQEAFFRILEEFNFANNAQWKVEIDGFVPQLQEIAMTVGKILKPEQLVASSLLIKS